MTGRVLQVVPMGHPLLKESSKSVEDPLALETQTLIKDMETTVEYIGCSGLAAPQVLAPVRVVIFRVMKTTTNPAYQLTPEYDPAGVLSLPGLLGKVPRHHSIQYTYLNRQGQEETRVAHGFHARVVQHECDHLDGILYPQRIKNMADFGFKEEIIKQM